MRKLLPLLLTLVVLVGAQSASTAAQKTVSVSITHAAFVPNTVTIDTGDTVTWTNNDTVNHQLVSQGAGIGSPIIKPGDTYSFTFAKAGRFTIGDALDNKYPKMTVRVTAAPATLSLVASAGAITYGGAVTLSGKLASRAGARVDIFAQECGSGGSKRVATATTDSTGGYTLTIRPPKISVFTAKNGNTTSADVTVKLRPKVVLSKVRTGHFRLRVYAAESLVGHAVAFQRYLAAQRKWRTVKTVVLRVQSSAVTPLTSTMVSAVTFGVRIRPGNRVRAVISTASAAPCYIAGSSPAIRS
jgi:plastocyanin